MVSHNFPQSTAHRAPRVLVAEDIRTLRIATIRLLDRRGIQTRGAVDGLAAWELLQREAFDFLITDFEMPRWNGLDLLRAMRQSWNPRIRLTPVVVTTTISSRAMVERISNFSLAYYLPKPLVMTDLEVLLGMIAIAQNGASSPTKHQDT